MYKTGMKRAPRLNREGTSFVQGWVIGAGGGGKQGWK